METITEPNLAGLRVLIVEDDYLFAYDAKEALTEAGAEVVGPFSNEADGIEAIRRGRLDAAITDVNLGFGPSFKTARALRDANVPFLLLTGYDRGSIPAEFADVPSLEKPVQSREIIREIAGLAARKCRPAASPRSR